MATRSTTGVDGTDANDGTNESHVANASDEPHQSSDSAEIHFNEFHASFTRAEQSLQLLWFSRLTEVQVVGHVMMLIVLRSLPPLRVDGPGRMAWRPAKEPLAAIR